MVYRPDSTKMSLHGKKGLVVGIANEHSIAYGCASVFRAMGAELAVTYMNEKARPFVEPWARELDASMFEPLDVQDEGDFDRLFDKIGEKWGRLDFVLHSIAFAPLADLHGRVTDCSLDGFLKAMHISVYSLIELTRRAEPLMDSGGTIITMSYYGAAQVVDNYNVMGPAKSALESTARYLAAELGKNKIRVHAISPGPLKTRAASGIGHFDELMSKACEKAPTHQLVTIEDVGFTAAFLASDAARNITGEVLYVDGGYHIMD